MGIPWDFENGSPMVQDNRCVSEAVSFSIVADPVTDTPTLAGSPNLSTVWQNLPWDTHGLSTGTNVPV